MFTNIFIHYLLSQNMIDKKQADEVVSKKDIKVRPSVIAVYERLMTEEQARIIAELQAINDMPFGFLAVREGFLTHEQVAASISGRHAKGDMKVIQALSDKGIMSMSKTMEYLNLFKEHHKLDDRAYEAIADNDVESFVRYMARVKDDYLLEKYAVVFIKTYMRCIDNSLRIGEAYTTDSIKGKYISKIECCGDRQMIVGAALDDEQSVLNLASRFVRQRQREYNEDVEDSIKEFINLAAGLFATLLEKDMSLDIDLMAPDVIIDGEFKADVPLGVIDMNTVDCALKIFIAEQ